MFSDGDGSPGWASAHFRATGVPSGKNAVKLKLQVMLTNINITYMANSENAKFGEKPNLKNPTRIFSSNQANRSYGYAFQYG